MSSYRAKWLEPIGLLLLLLAFGWQCFEEFGRQNQFEGYIYEIDQKLEAIWMSVYDEALHSERYHGDAVTYVNYDSLHASSKDWGQIKNDLEDVSQQVAISFWVRVVLYILGSISVIASKIPNKKDYCSAV